MRAIAPAIFGVPVVVAPPGEYVADGAARQAAWLLSGEVEPPQWTLTGATTVEGVEVFAPDSHMEFAFPSDERAVAFAGPSADKLPLKEVLTAVRDNKGALLTNKDLAALIQKVRGSSQRGSTRRAVGSPTPRSPPSRSVLEMSSETTSENTQVPIAK